MKEIRELYSEAEEEFNLACRYSKAALEFLGIPPESRFKDLYMDSIRNIDTQKRFKISYPCNIEKCFSLAIQKYLQEEENAILEELRKNQIDEKDPRILIIYFKKLLETTPQSYPTKKLLIQSEVLLELQSIETLAQFPFTDLWQLVIDGKKWDMGAYVFENEPGYVLGTLKGLLFALQTRNEVKNPSWYIQLHDICTQEVFPNLGYLHLLIEIIGRPNWPFEEAKNTFHSPHEKLRRLSFVTTELITADEKFRKNDFSPDFLPPGIRKPLQKGFNFGFLIPYELDSFGLIDLKKFDRNQWILFENLSIFLNSKSKEEIHERLKELFIGYLTLLNFAEDRADRLISHLWLARELEIHHVFKDGNGRSSILALFSIACSNESGILPLFFYNPNILDANGPHKLSILAIEAMQRANEKGASNLENQEKNRTTIENLKNEVNQKLLRQPWDIIHEKTGLAHIFKIPQQWWKEVLRKAVQIIKTCGSEKGPIEQAIEDISILCNSITLTDSEKSNLLLNCLQNYYIESSGIIVKYDNFREGIELTITTLYGEEAIPQRKFEFIGFFAKYIKPYLPLKKEAFIKQEIDHDDLLEDSNSL